MIAYPVVRVGICPHYVLSNMGERELKENSISEREYESQSFDALIKKGMSYDELPTASYLAMPLDKSQRWA